MKKIKYKNTLITSSNKQKIIKNLFNDVSEKYDIMNDFMSLGLHRFWKKSLLKNLKNESPKTILDLAGGTGDIAKGMSKLFSNSNILVYDLSLEMMLKSKSNCSKAQNIFYINGDAENLAIKDNSVDLITLSFGLRNFSNLEKSIQECYRVLKSGKRIYCLEFSPSFNNCIKPFYDFYSSKVIPQIGKKIAKNVEAYEYLVSSIRNFPHNHELKNIFTKKGFFCYNQEKYFGGIAYLNIFSKI